VRGDLALIHACKHRAARTHQRTTPGDGIHCPSLPSEVRSVEWADSTRVTRPGAPAAEGVQASGVRVRTLVGDPRAAARGAATFRYYIPELCIYSAPPTSHRSATGARDALAPWLKGRAAPRTLRGRSTYRGPFGPRLTCSFGLLRLNFVFGAVF
jgi:hypothetical protein